MYIKITEEGRVTALYSKKTGDGLIEVASVPQPENIEGKIPVMYWRDGKIVYDYIDEPPAPEPEPLPEPELSYEDEVNGMIRARYSLSEELSILRQRDTKPDEFDKYFRFAEECKARAKSAVPEGGQA